MFRFFAAAPDRGPALAVLFALTLGAASPAYASDDWLGRDKAWHFSISLALGAGGYGLSATFLDDPLPRAAVGFGFAMLLGVGKEIWDAMGHGDPSGRDLAWDVVGAATGVLLAYVIDRLVHRLRSHARPPMALGVAW